MLLGLSTGQKFGLALVAGLFIVFSLVSALVLPGRWPDFPGRRGLPVFIALTLAFFVAMLGALEVLARETHEVEREVDGGAAVTSSEDENEAARTGQNAPATTSAGASARDVRVDGTEFKFVLSTKDLAPGNYTFVLRNVGKVEHNLVISGPDVDNVATPVIQPGERSELRTALTSGSYKLYCSVQGHEETGMRLQVDVT